MCDNKNQFRRFFPSIQFRNFFLYIEKKTFAKLTCTTGACYISKFVLHRESNWYVPDNIFKLSLDFYNFTLVISSKILFSDFSSTNLHIYKCEIRFIMNNVVSKVIFFLNITTYGREKLMH